VTRDVCRAEANTTAISIRSRYDRGRCECEVLGECPAMFGRPMQRIAASPSYVLPSSEPSGYCDILCVIRSCGILLSGHLLGHQSHPDWGQDMFRLAADRAFIPVPVTPVQAHSSRNVLKRIL